MQSHFLRARTPDFGNREHVLRGWDAVRTHPELAAGVLSLLRAVVGFLFITHGLQKLVGFPAPIPGPPLDWTSLMGIAGLLETFGGAALIVGLFTRPVAFVLSGEMAAAYFIQHAAGGFWPMLNGGELAVLYCFLFMFFAVAGGGAWSLDQMWRGAYRARFEEAS